MKDPVNAIAACGLALGGALGMAGTVATQRNLQAAFWTIDGVALVVATSLLALKFFRKGNDVVAAGFLVFAIGEGVTLPGSATTLAGSVPSFAAGAALWSAALLLTSIPGQFALWVRLPGIIGSILFAITAARIFWGEQVLPTSSPLPFFAYPINILRNSQAGLFQATLINVQIQPTNVRTRNVTRRVHSPRSRGCSQGVGEINEEFVRPSHNVVFGRGDWSHWVSLLWAIGLIRSMRKMLVQPSNESQRTAPPEESAAGHTVHIRSAA
jgi:hypothetical protein